MTTFLGVDLGWYGKPSGLASIILDGSELRLRSVTRIQAMDEILAWIRTEAGEGSAVVGVDAPLVIPNATGIREGERELNRQFRRFDAGCHPANLSRPFASYLLRFSRDLEDLGFIHGPSIQPRQKGRFQIEVHPHSATVSLFGLERIVKYKKGLRADRARELGRLRRLTLKHLPELSPPLALKLPSIPKTGNLKPVEDQIDAVICAYIAAHWWWWAGQRNTVFGTEATGYIVVPRPHC